MDPSTAQQQEMPNNPSSSLENMLVCTTNASQQQQDRKPRPQPEQALKCPRCDSTNTKFCYYNNYSLSQPRYFCKSCRRYWTKGGTLRNVPVGGGCRKNKRSSSSSKKSQDQSLAVPNASHPLAASLPHLGYDTNDLSLAFARLQKQSVGFDHQDHHDQFAMLGGGDVNHVLGNPRSAGAAPAAAFLDALRSNFLGIHNGNFAHHGFHNYGYGQDGSLGEVEHGVGIGAGEQIGQMPFEDHQMSSSVAASTVAVSVATMKQESCDQTIRGDSRVLWGFPWQLSHGDHHHVPNMSNLDTARESWSNSTNFTSAWHGLLNSPLM